VSRSSAVRRPALSGSGSSRQRYPRRCSRQVLTGACSALISMHSRIRPRRREDRVPRVSALALSVKSSESNGNGQARQPGRDEHGRAAEHVRYGVMRMTEPSPTLLGATIQFETSSEPSGAGLPRAPEPLRGLRDSAARSDGVRLPDRGVECRSHSGGLRHAAVLLDPTDLGDGHGDAGGRRPPRGAARARSRSSGPVHVGRDGASTRGRERAVVSEEPGGTATTP